MNSSRATWLRSPWFTALAFAALLTSLVLGTVFVVIDNRGADAVGVQDAMTDAQAAAAVVGSAKQIVNVAQLRDVTGGYAFMSCRNESEPPYQVALYMNFHLPQGDSTKYLHDVAAAMIANGWSNAPSAAENFGYKLTNNGVTSIFYRDPNDANFGNMRLYGECRVAADHRHDDPVWTEVTQLG
ncbi:hypothetical protein [Mycobacterium sp. MMS18-G62]